MSLSPLQALAYEQVAILPFPVQMTARPGSHIGYVATKDGRIWWYDGFGIGGTPVLDLRERVRNRGERGLLSLALHPTDAGRLFVHYSNNAGDTVVSEFAFTGELEADPASERIMLQISQPASNHNGGMIQFGPDGALYVGLGDGGGANDRYGHGQNFDTLLGGMVQLKVDGEPSPILHNPGLRNPWRFWIDGRSIYIADVGQNSFEEVSVTDLEKGLNYGWPTMEGLHCFRPPSDCDPSGLVLPVVEVSHGDERTCSITGGIVYRGPAVPEVTGHYFYSDYCGGYLRSFRFDGQAVVEETDWTDDVGYAGQVTGFGVDGEGEMYVLTTDLMLKVVAVRG